MDKSDQKKITWVYTLSLLLLLVLIVIIGIYVPFRGDVNLIYVWFSILFLLFLFLIITGFNITNKWYGMLIDERNKISLSRFQMIIWTILILSAFLTAALSNISLHIKYHNSPKIISLNLIKNANTEFKKYYDVVPLKDDDTVKSYYILQGDKKIDDTYLSQLTKDVSNDNDLLVEKYSNPLSIAVPEILWLLMGITTTSLIGSPLLKNNRKAENVTPEFLAQVKSLYYEYGETISNIGNIIVNNSMENAKWSDMFKGEEIRNGDKIDLSKIQMFFFTIVLIICYGVVLAKMFIHNGIIIELPDVHPSIVVLLGISHAGYLGNKVIPK